MLSVDLIMGKARVEIDAETEMDINDWIQRTAILGKIWDHATGHMPRTCGSSVELWWKEQDARES